MEHHQDPIHFRSLDEAAKETTTALNRAHIRHGVIGGYATSLIGGDRITKARLPYILLHLE